VIFFKTAITAYNSEFCRRGLLQLPSLTFNLHEVKWHQHMTFWILKPQASRLNFQKKNDYQKHEIYPISSLIAHP
jgi:hypothetical protein